MQQELVAGQYTLVRLGHMHKAWHPSKVRPFGSEGSARNGVSHRASAWLGQIFMLRTQLLHLFMH
jgi:hypothetical protein